MVLIMCHFYFTETGNLILPFAEKGREEGRIRLLVKFVNEGILTVEKASQEAGVTAGEFEKILKGK